MNHNGILTTGKELQAQGADAYETLNEVGEFILRLDFRAWGNAKHCSTCLICYFTEECTGRKVKLYAWEKNGKYCPKKCEEDLQHATDGEEWICITGKSRTGRVQWEYGVENWTEE